MGMWIASNDMIVENNQIITEKHSATGIRVNSAQCRILKNRIEGMGTAAILIAPVKSLTGSNNRCEDNDVSAFRPSVAEVSLLKDSKNNTVVGSSGKAKDLGIDNQIKGMTRVTE
jgi:hypothetical protein